MATVIKINNIGRFTCLLNLFHDSNISYTELAKTCIFYDNNTILSFLLKTHLARIDIDKVVLMTGIKGNLELLQLLVVNFSISDKSLQDTTKLATFNSHITIMDYLIDEYNYNIIYFYKLLCLIEYFKLMDHVIDKYTNDKTCSTFINEGLSFSIINDKHKSVKKLLTQLNDLQQLDTLQNHSATHEKYYIMAVENKSYNAINAIKSQLATPTSECIDTCIMVATKNNDVDLVNMLLTEYPSVVPISAIKTAISNNEKHLVTLLDTHMDSYEECLECAILSANKDFINMYLPKTDIVDKPLLAALKMNNNLLVKYFIQCKHSCLKLAMQYASSVNFDDMELFDVDYNCYAWDLYKGTPYRYHKYSNTDLSTWRDYTEEHGG